jgi:hypothetical protein
MIADLGLSKQLTEATSHSIVYGMPAYIDPQCFKKDSYIRDKKSDIYSLGVLLWEITSGYPPFPEIQMQTLGFKIAMGLRENPIDGTPPNYVNLYQKCWDDDPSLRPTIGDVFNALKKFSSQFNSSDKDEFESAEGSNKQDDDGEKNESILTTSPPPSPPPPLNDGM